jgi:hypothetical protein
VDDIVLLLIALKAFVDLSPPSIVREHLEDLFGIKGDTDSPAEAGGSQTIDASYRIVEEPSSRTPRKESD